MERILNDNEKIRRAEEIYYRRNRRQAMIGTVNKMPKDNKKTYLGSKILLEMLILIILAVVVFAVKNKNYIFSQAFLENVAQYNVNITEKFAFFTKYFENDDQVESEDVFVNNDDQQVEETPNQEAPSEEVPAEVPQEGVSYIQPINGVITSRFGERASGNHTGIDIAANSGTEIQSSISGVVTQVSNEGNYGNHVRISKDNVTTLYAHCKEICVTEGQEILQGQVVATVGSTGNSTGPHLHFEIIIDGKQVNPDEIIQFS